MNTPMGAYVQPEPLTKTEQIVFSHLITGMNNKEIAIQTECAVATVKAHVTAILKYFKCDSRCRLIARHYRGEL